MKAKINAKLRPLLVRIDSLREDPANVNSHPERNLEDIKRSLAEFGQQKPVVAKGDGTVVAGSGTLRAARELGWEEIAAVTFDGTAERAKGYAIADNRAAESSQRLPDALARQLLELEEAWGTGWDPAIVGYREDEVAKLLQQAGLTEPEAAEAPESFKSLSDLKAEHRCPSCGYRWSGPIQ